MPPTVCFDVIIGRILADGRAGGGMEYRGTELSARARRSEPSWPSVIATTLRLWFERHPVFRGRRPRGRRTAVVLAVVIAVALVAGVTGVIIGRSARSP